MKLIGKVEEKKGNLATILVTKVLPCGNCKNCSAGCKNFRIYIQTEVDENINKGDVLDVKQIDEISLNNQFMQYLIPSLLMILSIILVYLIPQINNKGAASALAVLISIFASQFVVKLYNKLKMKNNSKHFSIIKKQNP